MIDSEEDGRVRTRSNKACLPPAEIVLWERLTKTDFKSYGFERDAILADHIIEFASATTKLALEIRPLEEGESSEDKRRQRGLLRQGYLLLRFAPSEIYEHIESVTDTIRLHGNVSTPHAGRPRLSTPRHFACVVRQTARTEDSKG